MPAIITTSVTSSTIANSHCCLFCEGNKVKNQWIVIVLSPLLYWAGVIVIDAYYNKKGTERKKIKICHSIQIGIVSWYKELCVFRHETGEIKRAESSFYPVKSCEIRVVVGKHCDLRHNV